MKKLLLLALTVILATCLFTGCSGDLIDYEALYDEIYESVYDDIYSKLYDDIYEDITGNIDGGSEGNGDAREIESAVINEDGELVISYSDGTVQNLGKITGEDGKTEKRAKRVTRVPTERTEALSLRAALPT